MAYGLTSAGFVKKPLQTIKAELEADFRGAFGDDLDVGADSVAGQLIGNQSKKWAQVWELLEAVVASFNPDSAENTNLDRAAALVYVRRLAASKTDVPLALYGDSGTVVSAGHTLKQTGSIYTFALTDAVTLGLGSPVLQFSFSVGTVTPGAAYTFTIDGTVISYTAAPGDDEADIVDGLVAALAAAALDITGVRNLDNSCTVTVDDGVSGFTLAFADAKLTLAAVGNYSRYLCTVTGPVSAPIGTVNIINTPVTGLDSAYNLAAGVPGANIESDASFRIRRRVSLQKGYATEEAMAYHLLSSVTNVTYAIVISNRTDAVDADGRPPHSLEAVVVGGEEQEIANKIWATAPAGIQFVGSISKTITDSAGRSQTVKFNRPIPRYIWAKIALSVYSEETFPADGATQIKAAIVQYSQDKLDLNTDVIRQRLYIPIYSVPGVGTVSLLSLAMTTTLTPPDPADYHEADIAIAPNQLAMFATTRIEVTVS